MIAQFPDRFFARKERLVKCLAAIRRLAISKSLAIGVSFSCALLVSPITSAEQYVIDPEHSNIGFRVRHMGIGWVEGQFTDYQGYFEYVPEDVSQWRTEATIKSTSIDTGLIKRDRHLRSHEFLHSADFPAIRFISNQVIPGEGGNFQLKGVLTIRDKSHEAVLNVKPGGTLVDPWGVKRAAFQATTTINRKDYGVIWNRILDNGSLFVGDEVEIILDIQGVVLVKAEVRMKDPSKPAKSQEIPGQ